MRPRIFLSAQDSPLRPQTIHRTVLTCLPVYKCRPLLPSRFRLLDGPDLCKGFGNNREYLIYDSLRDSTSSLDTIACSCPTSTYPHRLAILPCRGLHTCISPFHAPPYPDLRLKCSATSVDHLLSLDPTGFSCSCGHGPRLSPSLASTLSQRHCFTHPRCSA